MKIGRKPQILELLSRRRYGRRNFMGVCIGGNYQNRRVEIIELHKAGQLKLHPPHGNGNIERAYPDHYHRIFERQGHHEHGAEYFWHQVMIDDILMSIEGACKRQKWRFTDRDEILKGRQLELSAQVEWIIDGVTHTSKQPLRPDALFAIEGAHFALEADRGFEPIERNNLKQTSYFKKILQYRDVMKHRTFEKEWGIPSLSILNISTKPDRVQNILAVMRRENLHPKSMLFRAYPELVGIPATNKAGEHYLKSPQPLKNVFNDPYERAGQSSVNLAQEVGSRGRSTASKAA